METYTTIIYETYDGDLVETGIYTRYMPTWRETIAHTLNVARLLFGGDVVKSIVMFGGNAA